MEQHEELELWRDALRNGVKFLHKPTNFIVTGATVVGSSTFAVGIGAG